MTTSPAPATPDLDPADQDLAGLVRAYLRIHIEAFADGDQGLRDGVDRIYPTRVAARRIRSTLRTFADVFEPAPRRQLDRELRWWAGLLGEVRDRTVQIAGIGALADGIGDEPGVTPAREFVMAALTRQREHALHAVEAELSDDRQPHLRILVERWREPHFTARAAASRTAVVAYVEHARDHLDLALEHARRPSAADIDVHDARKAGKRYRYAVELAGPVLGDAATPAQERARALQDELGRYQDSVVGLALLDDLADSDQMDPLVRRGVDRLRAELTAAARTARGRALALTL